MNLPGIAMLPVLSLLSCVMPATAQSFVPETIQFNGVSDYSNAELMTAAGLTHGETVNDAILNASTQRLLETGLFEDIRFAYNDQLLAFQIIPGPVYPFRLENFPLNFGQDLEKRLRARFPLYRGKIPASGSLLDGVTAELQEELAAMKIPGATVTPTLYAEGNPGKITAISFSIKSPAIQIGEIQISILSGSMAGKVRLMATKLTGSAYSTDGSTNQLETSIAALYQDQGYLEAKIQATPRPLPLIDAKGVHIPYTITIEEGPQYKLSGVELAPDVIVPQATVDRLRALQVGETPSPEKLRRSCEFIAQEYRKKGFLKAQVSSSPTFDRAQGTVSYLITAQPGPQYTMGELTVEDVDDETRDKIVAALHLPQGAPFNEGAIVTMTTANDVDPDLARFFAAEKLLYNLSVHDDSHTVDVDLKPQKKQ